MMYMLHGYSLLSKVAQTDFTLKPSDCACQGHWGTYQYIILFQTSNKKQNKKLVYAAWLLTAVPGDRQIWLSSRVTVHAKDTEEPINTAHRFEKEFVDFGLGSLAKSTMQAACAGWGEVEPIGLFWLWKSSNPISNVVPREINLSQSKSCVRKLFSPCAGGLS